MTHDELLLHYKTILVDIITARLPDCTIYLFGSRARKTNQEGADIDIALDTGAPIEWDMLGRIRGDIDDSSLPIFVDVVDFNAASERMQEQIKKDRVTWKN